MAEPDRPKGKCACECPLGPLRLLGVRFRRLKASPLSRSRLEEPTRDVGEEGERGVLNLVLSFWRLGIGPHICILPNTAIGLIGLILPQRRSPTTPGARRVRRHWHVCRARGLVLLPPLVGNQRARDLRSRDRQRRPACNRRGARRRLAKERVLPIAQMPQFCLLVSARDSSHVAAIKLNCATACSPGQGV